MSLPPAYPTGLCNAWVGWPDVLANWQAIGEKLGELQTLTTEFLRAENRPSRQLAREAPLPETARNALQSRHWIAAIIKMGPPGTLAARRRRLSASYRKRR